MRVVDEHIIKTTRRQNGTANGSAPTTKRLSTVVTDGGQDLQFIRGERGGVLMPPPPPWHGTMAAAATAPPDHRRRHGPRFLHTYTHTSGAHTTTNNRRSLFFLYFIFFFPFLSDPTTVSLASPDSPTPGSRTLSLSVRLVSRAHAWRVPFRLTRSPSPPPDRLRGTVRRRLVVLSLTLSRVYSRDVVRLSPSRDLFFLSLFFFFFFFYF